jgi:hypothetical protein
MRLIFLRNYKMHHLPKNNRTFLVIKNRPNPRLEFNKSHYRQLSWVCKPKLGVSQIFEDPTKLDDNVKDEVNYP